MITLNWAPYPEASVSKYNVYRGILGFRFETVPVASLNGLTLELEFNEEDSTEITFNGTDPILDQINDVIVGGRAYQSDDPDFIIVRSDIRSAPGRVEIVGGTAMALLGLTAREITELSENEKIATINALLDPTLTVSYEDPDGSLQDWYAVSTVDNLNNESSKTQFRQPVTATGPVCVLEGIIYDLQGVRCPDVEVIAEVQVPPEHAGNLSAGNIIKEPVKAITGPDGRFSLVVLQCALIELQIPKAGFSHMIRVPEASYAFVNDILEDLDYRYPLGYRGPR